MKTHFITGAGSGIGKELCCLCLEKGDNVVAMLRNEDQKAELQMLSHKFPGALYICFMDLMDPHIENKINAFLTQHEINELHSLVNVAGILSQVSLGKITEKDILNQMKVNFVAPVLIMQTVYARLKRVKNSNILNITSMSGFQGSVRFPGLSIYGASKAALASFTESLSVEIEGVHINALAIGAVKTEMLKKAFPDFEAKISPQKMASYIYSFITEGNQFYNGKVIPVAISNP